MIHIDPATLRRYPIIGVLIGGATAVFLAYLLQSGWPEASALLAQKSPEPLSISEAVSLSGIRWITVSGGQWRCDQAVSVERRPGIERWFRGSIETTEVPINGTVEGELLVACFDGAVTCSERAGSSLTGVVGSTEIFTSRSAQRRWSRGGSRVAILNVGASPRWALIMLLGLVTIAVGGLIFAGYYLTLILRSGSPRPARLPVSDPIEPA